MFTRSTLRLALTFITTAIVCPGVGYADDALSTNSPCARSDDRSRSGEAEAIFRVGVDERDKKNCAAAIAHFKEALALVYHSPAMGPLYLMAKCEEDLGQTTAAYLHYAEFLREARSSDARRDEVKTTIARMRREKSSLRIVNLDKLASNTCVTVDGASVGVLSSEYNVPAEGGQHQIVIQEPGLPKRTLPVALNVGQSQEVSVKDPPPPPPPPNHLRTAAFVVGGVGAANLVAAIITGSVAAQRRATITSSCRDVVAPCTSETDYINYVNTGKTLGNASTATLVIGGALSAAGAALFLVATKKEKATDTAVAPLVLPGGGGISFGTRF